mgnify:CR=1 FL=1|jgi:hypothetical protein
MRRIYKSKTKKNKFNLKRRTRCKKLRGGKVQAPTKTSDLTNNLDKKADLKQTITKDIKKDEKDALSLVVNQEKKDYKEDEDDLDNDLDDIIKTPVEIEDDLADDIAKKINKLNPLNALSSSVFFDKIQNITKGVVVKTIEFWGGYFDIDFFNKEEVKKKLDNIYILLTDGETKRKLKIILPELSDYGIILIEAGYPFTKEFVEKSSEIINETIEDVTSENIKTLLNVAKTVPPFNMIIAGSEAASGVVMQLISFSTGMGDLLATVGNFTSKMSRNFTQLVKEKEKLKKELITGKESFENIKNINADGDVDD